MNLITVDQYNDDVEKDSAAVNQMKNNFNSSEYSPKAENLIMSGKSKAKHHAVIHEYRCNYNK